MAESFLDVEARYIRAKVLPDFAWTTCAEPTEPAPLRKPLGECTVALVVTAGAYLPASQPRFDVRNPLGDDSFRVIPGDAAPSEVALAHPGYDTRRARADLDTVFPYQLLNRLRAEGLIAGVARRHVSLMGYIPSTERLVSDRAPSIASLLRDDGIDLALLVPS